MAFTPTTWNPSDKGPNCTLSNGNLTAVTVLNSSVRSVVGVSSGKWYWEVRFDSGGPVPFAIGNASAPVSVVGGDASPGDNANSWCLFSLDGKKYTNNVGGVYGSAVSAGQTVGIKLDMDAGTLSFVERGADKGVAYSGLTGTIYAMTGSGSGASASTTANFGPDFAWVPAGYNAGLGTISGTTEGVSKANAYAVIDSNVAFASVGKLVAYAVTQAAANARRPAVFVCT